MGSIEVVSGMNGLRCRSIACKPDVMSIGAMSPRENSSSVRNASLMSLARDRVRGC